MKTIGDIAGQLLDNSFFLEEAVEMLEKSMISLALQRSENNQSEASKALGIHRNTLQRKMEEYKIDGKRRKPMARAGTDKRPRTGNKGA